MAYKYYPIGREVDYEGVTLKVVATFDNRPECLHCFFSDSEREKAKLPRMSCCIHGLLCTKHMRRDGKHVVFLKV